MNHSTKHDIAGDGRQRGSAASSRRPSSCRSVHSAARSCQSSRTKMSTIEGDEEEKENMEMEDKSMSVEWEDSHTRPRSCRGRGITDEKKITRRKKVRQVGVRRTNHRSSDRSSDRSARIRRRSTEDRTKNASMELDDILCSMKSEVSSFASKMDDANIKCDSSSSLVTGGRTKIKTSKSSLTNGLATFRRATADFESQRQELQHKRGERISHCKQRVAQNHANGMIDTTEADYLSILRLKKKYNDVDNFLDDRKDNRKK